MAGHKQIKRNTTKNKNRNFTSVTKFRRDLKRVSLSQVNISSRRKSTLKWVLSQIVYT